MYSRDDNANMFAYVLPVYNPVLMAEHMPDVRYPHGVYNCGISCDGGVRRGIVRSCTINSRHRLGRKSMPSKEYGSTVYLVDFDKSWTPIKYGELKLVETVHDVRLSMWNEKGFRGVGCARYNTPQGVRYWPISIKGVTGSHVTVRPLPKMPLMTGSQKNWIELPHEGETAHFDVGYVEEVGQRCVMSITKQGKVRLQSHVSRTTRQMKLRGGTNYVKLEGPDLLICYHVVDDLGDNVRDYKSVFSVVEGCFPFYVKAMTPPLKFQSSAAENLIQFPMGLVRDGEKLMISYGLADADNVIGEIRERDVMNLMS